MGSDIHIFVEKRVVAIDDACCSDWEFVDWTDLWNKEWPKPNRSDTHAWCAWFDIKPDARDYALFARMVGVRDYREAWGIEPQFKCNGLREVTKESRDWSWEGELHHVFHATLQELREANWTGLDGSSFLNWIHSHWLEKNADSAEIDIMITIGFDC